MVIGRKIPVRVCRVKVGAHKGKSRGAQCFAARDVAFQNALDTSLEMIVRPWFQPTGTELAIKLTNEHQYWPY